jgi:hypothetical protein
MHYSLLSLFDGVGAIRPRRYVMTKEEILQIMEENPYRAKWLAYHSSFLTEEERSQLIELAEMKIQIIEHEVSYSMAFPEPWD